MHHFTIILLQFQYDHATTTATFTILPDCANTEMEVVSSALPKTKSNGHLQLNPQSGCTMRLRSKKSPRYRINSIVLALVPRSFHLPAQER